MGRGSGILELMAAVVVAALTLAALRANAFLGTLLLAILPLVALRARAVLRADRAAGRPATLGRVARAWGVSLGRVLAAFGVALLLATFLMFLGVAAIVLAKAGPLLPPQPPHPRADPPAVAGHVAVLARPGRLDRHPAFAGNMAGGGPSPRRVGSC